MVADFRLDQLGRDSLLNWDRLLVGCLFDLGQTGDRFAVCALVSRIGRDYYSELLK